MAARENKESDPLPPKEALLTAKLSLTVSQPFESLASHSIPALPKPSLSQALARRP